MILIEADPIINHPHQLTHTGTIRANDINSDILATLRILKDRGVLTPELLERAYPILMTPKLEKIDK